MKYILIILLLIISVVFNTSCVDDVELPEKDYPFVETKDAVVTSTNVTLVGKLTQKGRDKIIDYGFIFINDSKEIKYSIYETNEIDDFEKIINTDLKKNTTYTYKAYIKTEKYLILGKAVTFTALGSEPPVVENINPNRGFDGTEVKISGKYFGSEKDKRHIYINDREVNISESGENYISFTIPPSSFVGDAVIRIVAGENETNTKFTVIGPEIESITPLSGHAGSYILVSGKNLTENGDQTMIYFGSYLGLILQKNIGANAQTTFTVAIPPADNVLSEVSSPIKLQNGEKIVEYKNTLLTKSSWKSHTSEYFGSDYKYDGFSYNNKGYVMEVESMEFHEYNSVADKWTTIKPISNKPDFYYNSLLIPSGDKFYKVGGLNYLLELNDDLWYFKISDKTWNKKNKLPFVFQSAKSFKLNNKTYIITDRKELWLCDFDNEKYSKLNNFPSDIDIFLLATFVTDNTAYLTTYGKTWKYNIQSDTWSEMASYPYTFGLYYSCMNAFTYKGNGYIQLGRNIYKYDSSYNYWVLASYYPDSRAYDREATFTINGRPYLFTTYDPFITETSMFEYHTE